jgi:spermidine synthase
LGMGYTLRQVLDMLSADANVLMCELLGAVVEWNRAFLGELNGHPLEDKRVDLKTGNVLDVISHSKGSVDAILLDIDNGPSAITDSGNRRLYGHHGMQACNQALGGQGCLAVWSAEPSKKFERVLMSCGFHVRRFRVPAHKGGKSPSRFVWVASENKSNLPPGGGVPHPPPRNGSTKSRRHPRGRR